jgi:exonuclease III
MKYTLCSFNCKNVKRSIQCIRDLCRRSDIVAIQESWLMPDDVTFLNTIDDNFCSTGTSAVDTTTGMLRGRPYGGVGLLWRRSIFQSVVVLPCDNPRLCAIKITATDNRPLIVVSVYMPTDSNDNLAEFTDCLATVNALIEEYSVESVYLMGDFNAHPNERFYTELSNFCNEQNWCCIDVDKLGITSNTYNFFSDAHLCKRWLDHFVVTQSVIGSVRNVYVDNCVTWSDHFPIFLECDLNIIAPRINSQASASNNSNNIIWGKRSAEQVLVYNKHCHQKLKLIDFPAELRACADKHCQNTEHKKVLDKLYGNVIRILREAAKIGRAKKKREER